MDQEDIPKTKYQRKSEQKMAEGQEQSDAANQGYYTGSEGDESSGPASRAAGKGAAKGAAKLATSTNPVGRAAGLALGLFARNKKASITGGGILSVIIGVFIFVSSILPATQLIWMGAIFNDFNFGPHHRNVVNRSVRVKKRLGDVSQQDTRMGKQAEAIVSDDARVDKLDKTNKEMLGRTNQRHKFRSTIARKINTARPPNADRFRWRFFTGDSADSDGFRSPKKRFRGTDDGRQRTNIDGRYEDAANDTRNSNNPSRTARSHARGIAKGSLIGASLAVGCSSALISDAIPDKKERYEILMGRAGDFHTAGSQLGANENVHSDEVTDAMSAFQDTEYIPESERLKNEEVDTGGITAAPPEEGESTPEEPVADKDSLAGSEVDKALADAEEKEVHRSFSHSAAWKRATNQEVQGNEPDIEMSFPAENGFLASGVLSIGRTLGMIPGFTSLCGVVSNPYIGWTLTGVEGVVSLFSGPAAVGRFAAVEALITGLSFMITNMAFDAMVPEGPAELMGHIDAGGNMANSENSRDQGAPPVSNDQMNEQRQAHLEKLADEDLERGLVWRYLSPDNHRSVLASVAMSTGTLSTADLIKPFTNFSTVISSAFGRLFTPLSADGHDNEFDNYKIEQFAFSEDTLKNIDPAENDKKMDRIEGYRCTENEAGNYIDSNGNPCNMGRWSNAVLMELITEDCMKRPYYEHMDNDWTYEREEGPIKHKIDCRTAKNPDNGRNYRPFWGQLGVWKLDQDIVDNIDCLTHNNPCVDVGGEGSRDESSSSANLPSGSAQELAQQLLDSSIGIDGGPRSQLQQVANGEPLLDQRILAVVSALGEKHEFTVTSLRREDECRPRGSRHTCGLAADISGSRGIDGVVYGYRGHDETVQSFINSAAETLLEVGSDNCGIGVPNSRYVRVTQDSYPSCTVFVDEGAAPHVHIDVRR